MRKGPARLREILPDPIYSNLVVTKLINRVMHDGKKTVAEKEIYKAFDIIKTRTGEEPLSVFIGAIENIKPTMEVRPRRIGGAAYQVPMSVRGSRRESLAIRWLILAARGRAGAEYRSFAEKLASEIIDARQNLGGAMKKKQDMERVAEANRAFAHFRW